MVHSTVKAAPLYAAGKVNAAGVVPARIAALTEGVLKAMLVTRLTIAATVLLTTILIGGAGVVGRHALEGEQQSQPRTKAAQFRKQKPTIPKSATKTEKSSLRFQVLKHDHRVGPIAWGADRKTLVSVTYDAKLTAAAVRLWDLQTRTVKRTLTDKDGKFSPYDASVAFSADGKIVGAAHSVVGDRKLTGEVLLWDAESGKLKHRLEHGTLGIRCLAFSPDSRRVASGSGGNLGRDIAIVKLWDVKTGKLLRSLKTTDRMAVQLAFSGDGKWLAVMAQDKNAQEVLLWDTATGEMVSTFGQHEVFGSVSFPSTGKILAALTYTGTGDENKCALKLYDISTSQLKRTQAFQKKSVRLTGYGGALSPDGKVMAHAARQGKKTIITLWDVKSGSLKKTLEGPPPGSYYYLAFSRDGKVLAASSGGKTIKLWELR
jgi:WD40 repeat protein